MAPLALLIWPIIVLIIFAQMPLQRAIIWSFLAGYLFLPEAFSFDLRGLPPFDKTTVSVYAVFLAMLIFAKKTQGRAAGQTPAPKAEQGGRIGLVLAILVVVLILSPLLTIADNRRVIIYGPLVLKGASLRDFINELSENFVLLVPFLLARRYFSTPASHLMLLRILVTGGLIYSALALVEVRLSPQLHNWIYGFHQHSFLQHIRGGSFRPKIFLDHGLSVGFFFLTAVICAFAIHLSKVKEDAGKYLYTALWLSFILFISKNLGATALALLLVPVLWLRSSMQVKIVKVIAILFLLYPAVRQSGVFPLTQIMESASVVSEERAASLMFRFRNEDALLARAAEKPLTGWGGWARARVFSETGRSLSITDGTWILRLGETGWLGYIALFGLLTVPLLMLKPAQKGQPIPLATMALALILAANLIYLIPNSTLPPLTWLMAGALVGYIQYYRGETDVSDDTPSVQGRPGPRYTRFPPQPAASGQGRRAAPGR